MNTSKQPNPSQTPPRVSAQYKNSVVSQQQTEPPQGLKLPGSRGKLESTHLHANLILISFTYLQPHAPRVLLLFPIAPAEHYKHHVHAPAEALPHALRPLDADLCPFLCCGCAPPHFRKSLFSFLSLSLELLFPRLFAQSCNPPHPASCFAAFWICCGPFFYSKTTADAQLPP